jgi:hypothetical protein
MIIARTLKFFKAVLTDAARALRGSPPAAPVYRRNALIGRGDYILA